LLGAIYQTLSDPVIIFTSKKEEQKAELFVKSFKKEKGVDAVISVVIDHYDDVKPIKVSISTHKKNVNNILNKIKSPDDIVYEKTNIIGATPSEEISRG
jgi:hypothetical protein